MLTPRQQEIQDLVDLGWKNDEIAKKLDISYQTVRSHKKVINRKLRNVQNEIGRKEEEKFVTDFKEDSGTINSLTYRLKTVDDVINFAEIDLEVWEVERVKTNYYEMGRKDKKVDMSWKDGVSTGTVKDTGGWNTNKLWQISVWFKKRQLDPVIEALKNVTKIVGVKAPKFMPIKRNHVNYPHLLEISLSDAHFGKLTVEGKGLDTTEQIYQLAVDNILNKTMGFNVDKIVVPLGSDFFHIDNMENSTKKFTRQDSSHHLFDIYDRGCQAVVKMVYKLREVAPVEIIWVPGNHDFCTSRYLCTWMQAWFRNDLEVNVRVGKNPRKYVNYSKTLLGYTQKKKKKHVDLPNLMMTENRNNLEGMDYFEWHIGHFHKKKEMKFVASDTIGHIPVKTLPSLSGTDYWHLTKGYISNRVLESNLYSYEFGPSGNFITNLEELEI